MNPLEDLSVGAEAGRLPVTINPQLRFVDVVKSGHQLLEVTGGDLQGAAGEDLGGRGHLVLQKLALQNTEEEVMPRGTGELVVQNPAGRSFSSTRSSFNSGSVGDSASSRSTDLLGSRLQIRTVFPILLVIHEGNIQ